MILAFAVMVGPILIAVFNHIMVPSDYNIETA